MKLFNKKYLEGFTLNREYEFTFSEFDKISHCSYFEVFDDYGDEWVFSKYKIFEYFSFNNPIK